MFQPLPRSRPAACTSHPDELARGEGFRCVAGLDEAGRGPWAGPVVAAAVILHQRRLPVRIDDSKRLTPRQRERAFRVILESADVGIGIVTAEEIDRRNILQATLLAMAQAVADLPLTPDLVLVDGTSRPPLQVPSWVIVHGDQRSYAIGCASIAAKVVRDELMNFYDRLHPEYSFKEHKGYGTARHAEALRRWGPCILHRRTFRPVSDCAREQPILDGEGAVAPAPRTPAEV